MKPSDKHWKEILTDNPIGTVETYWIDFGLEVEVEPDVSSTPEYETRARAGGVETQFSEEYGHVFRTTIPVVQTGSAEDQQHYTDEVVEVVEWLLSGTTSVMERPQAVFDKLKLLTSVPKKFVGDTVPNTGAQLVEASLHAVRGTLDAAVYDLIVLYLIQVSQYQDGEESAEETLAFIVENWGLGDAGAAEKYREGLRLPRSTIDWVAEAERLD